MNINHNHKLIRENEGADISFILPVFGNSQSLRPLVKEILLCCQRLKVQPEIILVEDCSKDRSWQSILKLHKEFPSVRGYRFRQNYGQHAAVLYGMFMACSSNCVIMDADMQDDPKHVTELLKKQVGTGAEVVFAGRTGTYQSWTRMITSRLYRFFLLENVVGLPRGAGMYFLITQKGRDRILLSPISGPPMVIGMIAAANISCISVPVGRRKRVHGTSFYTFNKRFRSAIRMIRCARGNHNPLNVSVTDYLKTLKVAECIP
jgi:glycosyltransferase involved in cell wall biosynthesis